MSWSFPLCPMQPLTADLNKVRCVMSEWIPIQDKWPPNGRDYLVAYKSDQYTILKVAEADGYVEHGGVEIPHWKGIMGNGPNVTHWMELPEPPEDV